jgi:hypothetical protein
MQNAIPIIIAAVVIALMNAYLVVITLLAIKDSKDRHESLVEVVKQLHTNA